MIVTALRYRLKHESEYHVWRFTNGVGALRNFLCFPVPGPQVNDVAEAVGYGLNNAPSSLFADVAVQLADSAGDTWVIQRSGVSTRYLRNGKPLTEAEAKTSMLAALLDLDVGANETTSESADLAARVQTIAVTPSGLKARPFGAKRDHREDLAYEIECHAHDIAAAYAEAAQEPSLKNPVSLAQLATTVEPLLAKLTEIHQQHGEFAAVAEGEQARSLRAQNLGAELDLIKQIEAAAAPFLDPAQSTPNLRKNLDLAETKLTEGLAALGLEVLPTPNQIKEWRLPIQLLSQLESLRLLMAESENALRTATDVLEPNYNGYLGTLDQAFKRDADLSLQLEQALTTLSIRQSRAGQATSVSNGERARKSALNLTWFDKFKAERPAGPDDPAPELLDRSTLNSIELARTALGQTMVRLTELRSMVDGFRDDRLAFRTQAEETHKALMGEFNKVRDEWTALAQALELPFEISLNQLCSLASAHAELYALHEERETLRAKLRLRKAQLAKLEQTVSVWRAHTGSQKSVDLSNAQILVSEARAIIRYLPEKEQAHQKLKAATDSSQVKLVAGEILSVRRSKLVAAWKAAFAQVGLQPMRLTDPRLPDLIQAGQALRGVSELAKRASSGVAAASAELFGQDASSPPIMVYLWTRDEKVGDGALHRAELLRHAEKTNSSSAQIIITSDLELAAEFFKRGSGRAVVVTQQPQAKPVKSIEQGLNSPTKGPPKSLLSDKAHAALAALTTSRPK